MLKYIADFMGKELMLVIEVDGVTHDDEATLIKDQRKQEELEKAGFTVVRFTDKEVLTNMNGVIAFLEYWIEKKEKDKSTPLPPASGGQCFDR